MNKEKMKNEQELPTKIPLDANFLFELTKEQKRRLFLMAFKRNESGANLLRYLIDQAYEEYEESKKQVIHRLQVAE